MEEEDSAGCFLRFEDVNLATVAGSCYYYYRFR